MTPIPTKQQQMRRWQIEASQAYAEANAWHFLARVTPGGGKTYWALRIAQAELCQGTVERIVLIVPTLPIKNQWIEQFAEHLGLKLVDYNAYEAGGIGFITTYQQVAGTSGAENFRKYCEEFRVFAILDEVHHASDTNTWGERLRCAFTGAARILSLTGTPFRSDGRPVPFVRYENNLCQPDYSFVYPQALADNIVRSLRFVFYDGTARWQRDGEPPEEGQVSVTGEESPETLRAALDPSGDFARAMIAGAHTELMKMPIGAAGLLVAKDTEHANQLAGLLAEITGRHPVVVHTGSSGFKSKIKAFRKSHDSWIVSVRMVSEGVDIPRVRVICWMTNYLTQIYFEQLIARGLRGPAHEECVVVLPQLPTLVAMSYAVTHAKIPSLTKSLSSGKDEEGSGNGRVQGMVTFLGSDGYLSKVFSPNKTFAESEVMQEFSAKLSAKRKAYQVEYKNTSKYKDQQAEYRQKPEVREAHNRRAATYMKKPEAKAKRKSWMKDPDNKPKVSEYQKAYRERSKLRVSAYQKDYNQRHEVKARRNEWKQSEDQKAKRAAYEQRPEVKARKASNAKALRQKRLQDPCYREQEKQRSLEAYHKKMLDPDYRRKMADQAKSRREKKKSS